MSFLPPFFQQVDRNGKPISNWSIEFYDDESADPITVYKDPSFRAPWGTSVQADAFGSMPPVYVKPRPDPYRVVFRFPTGTTKEVRGLTTAEAQAAVAAATGVRFPSIPKDSGTVALSASDFGHVVEIPTTPSTPAIAVLPDAGNQPDGSVIIIRNKGTGVISFQTLGDDTIDIGGISKPNASVALVAGPSGYETIADAAPAVGTKAAQMMELSASYASGTTSLSASGFTPAPPAGAWTFQPLNTADHNSIENALLLETGRVALPAGTYRIKARRSFSGPITAAIAFASTTTSLIIKSAPRVFSSSEGGDVVFEKVLVVPTAQSFELRWILSGTPDAFALGEAGAIAGVNEVYASVLIEGGI